MPHRSSARPLACVLPVAAMSQTKSGPMRKARTHSGQSRAVRWLEARREAPLPLRRPTAILHGLLHLSEARTRDLWTKLQQPQLPVPPLCRPTPGTGRQAQVWRWFLHCLFRFLRRIVHRFAPGSSGSGALLEQSLVEGRPPRAGQKQQNSSGQQTPVQVTRTPAAPRDLHPEGRDDHLERE